MLRLLRLPAVRVASRSAKTKASTLIAGSVIEFENNLFRVDSAEHVSMGRWKAYMKVDMKALRSPKKRSHRFRTDELVEMPDTDTQQLRFVGESADDDALVFEDVTSGESTVLRRADVHPELHVYLAEGDVCRVLRTEDEVLECILPVVVRATVAETTDAARVTAYKPALLTNGRTVQVPHFVAAGDDVTVKLPDETYHGKAER